MSFEYANNGVAGVTTRGYSDGSGGTISYGNQYGNGGRGAYNPATGSADATPTGTASLPQAVKDYFSRKVIIEEAKEQYFQPLAVTRNLAPNTGKYIKDYVWRPLIDDRNINDQGIDANGLYYANGNLYGSSRDISTIVGKLPVIGENGGRYNRVGFTRELIEGTVSDLGFFFEYTKDMTQFDTQADLLSHFYREAMRGANKITEDVLQIDLITNAAANTYRPGNAASDAAMTSANEITYQDLIKIAAKLRDDRVPQECKMCTGSTNTDTRTIPGAWNLYIPPEMRPTFMAMLDLHNRPAFIPVEQYGSQTQPIKGEIGRVYEFRLIEVPDMVYNKNAGNSVSNSDTIPYQSTSVTTGTGNDAVTTTKYDIFDMLLIGPESFNTIGFRTDGKSFKFEIMSRAPGEQSADPYHDPYGRHGFWSIQWTYGFMVLRPERLMCIKSVARA